MGETTTSLVQVEASTRGLVLNNLEDMRTIAQIILQSKLAPESFKTAEAIFVGLQAGAEVGLKPMQSLNSIVVIKGKPTLWGDAALALVKKSGLSEYCNEYFELDGEKVTEKDIQYTDIKDYPDDLIAVCETKRKDDPKSIIRYFSVADAKLAHLWKKAGPWTTHPKRMLKYKARAFNLRDNFPDVLYGMHLAEEFIGEEPLPAPQTDVLPRDERRSLAVPSSTIDTTRAPAQEAESEEVKTPAELLAESQKELDDIAANADVPAGEPSIEEKGNVAALFVEVNGMYAAQNGQDFAEFAAYVLCLDESEVDAPSKLTEEMLKTIKAYIETNGVAIS